MKSGNKFERIIVTMPEALVAELRRFADAFRGGNKSGFVADALRAHINYLRKRRHTAKLRASYAASARASRKIAEDWESLSDEVWELLDRTEARERKG